MIADREPLPNARYTHVLNRGALGVRSPADRLEGA